MIEATRNLVIVAATAVLVIVASGVAQGGFEALFPDASRQMFGSTDLSTYFVTVVLGALFVCAGNAVPRWLRTMFPLLWLLLPIIGLWVFAIVRFPGSFSCVPGITTGCWVVHMPFAVAVCAMAAGTTLRRFRNAA
jgi:hypothetical protein